MPAGDIGVGAREIGYMFGQYKRLRNEVTVSYTHLDVYKRQVISRAAISKKPRTAAPGLTQSWPMRATQPLSRIHI